MKWLIKVAFSDPGEKYDPKELKIGTEIEKEHKPTIEFIKNYYEKNKKWPKDEEVFAMIAKDHLDEFANYYSEGLVPMEEKLEKEGK